MTGVLASRAAALKLAVIVGVLMLPMVLLTILMVNGLRAEISSTERELRAVALSRLVMPVMLGAASGRVAPEALEQLTTRGGVHAGDLGLGQLLASTLSDLATFADDPRHAVPALARLQSGITLASSRSGEPGAEVHHLGQLFSSQLPNMLAAHSVLAVQREGVLRDGRIATEEAAALFLSAGIWLDSHRKVRDSLQQARKASASFIAYNAPLSRLRTMTAHPREVVAIVSRSFAEDMSRVLKEAAPFALQTETILPDVNELWSFAADRYEALDRERLTALTQRLYWMLGLALAACIIGVGGAAFMFRSTLRRLDDVKHARDEADAARREAESAAVELQRVNDDVIRLNADLSRNLRLLRETQDESLKKGKMAQLGQLTATVAHELRNPLGAVRTSVFLLERKLKGKGLNIEPQLERINNGVTRCDNIISQLLDFARSKSLSLEPLDFDDWLEGLVKEEAEKLPSSIAIECALGVGAGQVLIDPARMNRVFINLLSNAAEALVGKGDDPAKCTAHQPTITVSSRQTKRGIEVSVRDNGPGIPLENQERIFEPLFTTKNFGTGLGLPAVRKILEQHGGGLEVSSVLGQGATFTAWWPVANVTEEAA